MRQAAHHKAIRPALRTHLLTAAVGTAAFAAEDALTARGVGWVHSLWHLLSCAAVSSMGTLLAHKEGMQIEAALAASGTVPAGTPGSRRGGPKPGLRPVHCSAASLNGLYGSSPSGLSPKSLPFEPLPAL